MTASDGYALIGAFLGAAIWYKLGRIEAKMEAYRRDLDGLGDKVRDLDKRP